MKIKKRTEKTESSLNSRLALLERIVDSFPEAVIAMDCDGKAVVWGRAAEEMTELRKEDIPGRGEYACTVPFYGEPRPTFVGTFIHTLSQVVHETLDAGVVARRALEIVLDIAGAAGGSVGLLHEGQTGEWFSETAAALVPGSELRVFPDDKIIATVWGEGRAVQFDSRSQNATVNERRPAVAVPIAEGGTVTGVLTVIGRLEDGHFGEDMVAFLTTLGTILGQALQNARIYHQQKIRLTILERLICLRQKFSVTLEENQALELAMADVQDFLGVQWSVLRLLDKETGELVMVSSSGLDAELKEKAGRVRPEGSLLGVAMQKGKTVIVEDMAAASPELRLPYYASEMRSIAVAPIIAGREILGALRVYSPIQRRWPEDDVRFLTAVAGLLGLALADLRLHASLRQQSWKVICCLSAALESKDEYTRGHAERVARLALACARTLDKAEEQLEHLWQAAMVHDIGKIGVSDNILLKPGHLEQAEWEEVKKHSVAGADIIKEGGLPEEVVLAVRHHHEDWGGGGYPDSLTGEEIPLLARVLRVADAYDAMTTDRPYRRGIMAAEAMERLRQGAGWQFDPRVVEAFRDIPALEMEEIGRGGGGGS